MPEVVKYRRMRITLQAMQFDGTLENAITVLEFVNGGDKQGAATFTLGDGEPLLFIATLEGVMAARPGWWIIRGVAGEFYPCEGSIFDQSYERVVKAPPRPDVGSWSPAELSLDDEVERIYALLEFAIGEERTRQVNVEGFDADHDAGHFSDLHLASVCYEYQAKLLIMSGPGALLAIAPPSWPWAGVDWKPVPEVDGMLIKAGALSMAATDEGKADVLRRSAFKQPRLSPNSRPKSEWSRKVEPVESDDEANDEPERRPVEVCTTCFVERPCTCDDGL
ncbi:hypothetical protein [Subtercola sp. RTI3]|uniref:hypothetical protein n=1 Tax=Subtercola sp. RTI3 TaxID=3048639 RepID=UPI002B227288|nr:hypothetical protein [Subtercola sp. RTI3]MEA9983663.1 hypothetical protein [Subtercola sp. RTI3]